MNKTYPIITLSLLLFGVGCAKKDPKSKSYKLIASAVPCSGDQIQEADKVSAGLRELSFKEITTRNYRIVGLTKAVTYIESNQYSARHSADFAGVGASV